ncbi:acireductone dioxygenase-like protein [Leptotrombidium deliense]|uniref:Acireductone dioxygenase n=1 Tax=Leptotrombidium deliense TaxID=299467 RepID=A0A443SMA8_9ACAR|nr:acireductone dioxygenase-like protein [Leptotrombidium deliense]
MVKIWYMNENDEEDQRSERHLKPAHYIDLQELKQKTGVEYFAIDADNYESDGKLAVIRKERNYTYSDFLECSPKTLPDYCDKIKMFFKEHLHADEEIRFVLDGSGFFDVRDTDDKWIRILVEKGDLIVLPAGIYHRFTLDNNDYIRVMRLFVGEPVWTPINRPADEHPSRATYLEKAAHKFE